MTILLFFNIILLEYLVKLISRLFRSGTTEAFNKLSSLNVPIVVLSAGIGDVVKLILKHENLMTDNVTIVSNFLDVSKDDSTGVSTIHGYKGDKIIHVYNKNEHVYMDEHKNVGMTKTRWTVL